MALIRKSELADKMGVSRAYISKLIREGKIEVVDGLVDENALQEYTDLKEQLLEVRLQNELLKGDILRIKVKEKESRFISKEEVRATLEHQKQKLWKMSEKLIDKLSPMIANMSSAAKINEIMSREIRDALIKFCEEK